MSDKRRRRYGKSRNLMENRPITLARREDNRAADVDTQPKILLKTKWNEDGGVSGSSGRGSGSGSSGVVGVGDNSMDVPLKTNIVARSSDGAASAASFASLNVPTDISVNVRGEQQTQTASDAPAFGASVTASVGGVSSNTSLSESVPQMTRPATVVSSTGLVNANARKLLDKTNGDFLVVGVIGTQGVGKSTIMNLLANEQHDYNYYKRVFVDEEGVFPTKLKQQKCSARSRTESTHMFITSHRLILLDSPPVLCNSYKKDMTTNELDDLRHIISFLSVCHLLIVVQDEYINMNFLRLLQLAELMKPMHDAKHFNADYFPNLLFVKNRAKRLDYEDGGKERWDSMLRAFFRDTQLRVYVGQTTATKTTDAQQQHQQRKKKPSGVVASVATSVVTASSSSTSSSTGADGERRINSFLLPEVTSEDRKPYHDPLCDIIGNLRDLVFMTPRNDMYAATENIWFELLTKVAQDTQHFFFNTYENIQRRHLELGNASATTSGSGGGSNSNANQTNTTRYEN